MFGKSRYSAPLRKVLRRWLRRIGTMKTPPSIAAEMLRFPDLLHLTANTKPGIDAEMARIGDPGHRYAKKLPPQQEVGIFWASFTE